MDTNEDKANAQEMERLAEQNRQLREELLSQEKELKRKDELIKGYQETLQNAINEIEKLQDE